jgi:AraC-like DNA-binding protein
MEILNVIILLGAIQGLILSGVLFFSKTPGTKFLGGFIFVLAYNGLETYNWSAELDLWLFSMFPFVVIFAAGPCLYFYSKSLLDSTASKTKSENILPHLIPLMLLAIFRIGMLCFHWYALETKSPMTTTLFSIEMWFQTLSEPLSFISYTTYLWMSWRNFKEKNGGAREINAAPEQLWSARWAKRFLLTMTGVAIAWLLTIVLPRLFTDDNDLDLHYYPIEMMLVVLIYWITFSGHHRTTIMLTKPTKQAGQQLDLELVERCKIRLRESMESEKMYLDPELTVAKVAQHINIPPKAVSAIINQYLGKSFNDYINSYRVAEVKARLVQNTDQHLTIAGIGFDCGFNSQATFQRAFKTFVKQSPKEFLAEHRKRHDNHEMKDQIRI